MNCILKKFILKTVNKVLDEHKTNVEKAKATVSTWTTRTKRLLECLESLQTKLDDNKIDDKELEEAVKDVQDLVKEWK
jgi:chromosome segregation ATPase